MNFITYSTSLFPNLSQAQQIILESSTHTSHVNSINICNISTNSIRVNLVKKVIGSDLSNIEVFIVKNLEIPASVTGKIDSKSTVNLVSLFGLDLFLPVNDIGSVNYTTQLICYSNGINQNFDCVVDYTIFVEAPITFT